MRFQSVLMVLLVCSCATAFAENKDLTRIHFLIEQNEASRAKLRTVELDYTIDYQYDDLHDSSVNEKRIGHLSADGDDSYMTFTKTNGIAGADLRPTGHRLKMNS